MEFTATTRRNVALLFALATAIGTLLFSYRYLERLSGGAEHAAFGPILIDQLTGAYTAVLLFPLITWVTRRWPITRSTWPTAIPLALLGAVAFTALHTSLMWGTRSALYPLFGFGAYDYGDMLFRYPMEASQDVIIYAVVTGFVYFLDRMASARRAEVRAADLQTELASARLENLRLQLNPHFLFNTLNAVSAVMHEDVQRADEMLAKLSDYLRAVLESSGIEQVALAQELQIERMYVEIMTARLERCVDLAVDADDAVRGAAVPFMILQPLIENSIRHGMKQDRGIRIEIAGRLQNGSTVLSVSDDGNGLRGTLPTEGNGLRIVRSRLLHLFGERASFAIVDAPLGGTRSEIVLPYLASAGGLG